MLMSIDRDKNKEQKKLGTNAYIWSLFNVSNQLRPILNFVYPRESLQIETAGNLL